MQNRKKLWIIILIIILIIAIAAIYILKSNSKNSENSKNEMNNKAIADMIQNNEIENNSIKDEKGSIEIVKETIKANIEDKIYTVILEQNETAKQFINMLPQEFNMSELNGNEKYVYLNTTLDTNPYNPKHIESGDIMLYGNKCLVVFYKSFDTTYSYTKIGHIENLDNLGSNSISIKFEK